MKHREGEKKTETNALSIGDLWDTIKPSNIHVLGILGGGGESTKNGQMCFQI